MKQYVLWDYYPQTSKALGNCITLLLLKTNDDKLSSLEKYRIVVHSCVDQKSSMGWRGREEREAEIKMSATQSETLGGNPLSSSFFVVGSGIAQSVGGSGASHVADVNKRASPSWGSSPLAWSISTISYFALLLPFPSPHSEFILITATKLIILPLGVSPPSCWNPDDLHPVLSCPGKLSHLLDPEPRASLLLDLVIAIFLRLPPGLSVLEDLLWSPACHYQTLQSSLYVSAKQLSSLCLNISGGRNALPFRVSVFIHSSNSIHLVNVFWP